MIRNEETFGRMCRQMIRNGPTPMKRAAATNSRSRSERVIERITRAVIIQLNTASSTTKAIQPLPRRRGEITAITRNAGKISIRSTRKVSTRSVQPPKYPAQAPTSEARPVDSTATSRPITSDFCRPRTVCANTSCPRPFVPNQCCPDGGWRSAV